ncbi:hypothetical protein VVMO6_00061 [Vibrio vulnificus MO6-24/O]|nr:hypothetical protein VVMO6_00061 [Vibrio vulnificus MO6-24/O]
MKIKVLNAKKLKYRHKRATRYEKGEISSQIERFISNFA